MKKCVLIGDCSQNEIVDGNLKVNIIDKKIVEMIKKESPVFLFIGLASSYADSRYDKIKKVYQKLNCVTTYLKKSNLIHNPDLVKNKIDQADIIYIGGGDTIKLLKEIMEFDLKPLLENAYRRGCVFVGLSAGAIALAKTGFSDSGILRGEREDYNFIKGLGFANLEICPHYHDNIERTEQLLEAIKDTRKVVYGLEKDTALIISGNNIEVLSSFGNKVFKISYTDKYIEKEIN